MLCIEEVWNKAIDLVLAQEAEKAEILLHRLVKHLRPGTLKGLALVLRYRHNPRFRVVDEDEGRPSLQNIKRNLTAGDHGEIGGSPGCTPPHAIACRCMSCQILRH